jgi:hypothetical protein
LKSDPCESERLSLIGEKKSDFSSTGLIGRMNHGFNDFNQRAETVISANEKHFEPLKKDFLNFCDKPLGNDESIKKYCEQNNIPFEE